MKVVFLKLKRTKEWTEISSRLQPKNEHVFQKIVKIKIFGWLAQAVLKFRINPNFTQFFLTPLESI